MNQHQIIGTTVCVVAVLLVSAKLLPHFFTRRPAPPPPPPPPGGGAPPPPAPTGMAKTVFKWIGWIALVVALGTLAFIGLWIAFAITIASILLLLILWWAGSGFRQFFGGLVTTAGMILLLMWIYTNHMRRVETPPLSASDPTTYLYTLTMYDGDVEIDRDSLVRMTESSSAALAFEYTENSGSKCRFVQKLGPGGDTGHFEGRQNGRGTFSVTEFLPGKVSVVKGNIRFEKSGYGKPVNRLLFFTLAPNGR